MERGSSEEWRSGGENETENTFFTQYIVHYDSIIHVTHTE